VSSASSHKLFVVSAIIALLLTAASVVLRDQHRTITLDPQTGFTTQEPQPILGMRAQTFYSCTGVLFGVMAFGSIVGAFRTRPRALAP